MKSPRLGNAIDNHRTPMKIKRLLHQFAIARVYMTGRVMGYEYEL